MNSRKRAPQDLKVHIASTDSSPRASVALDEEDVTMGETFVPTRPLSVAIPRTFGAQGPYCPRRPNLSEILANESPSPWTLSAFMAYLSQNHCLETLEFTMDASRYGKHYTKMVGRIPGGVLLPTSEEANYLLMLWQRLLEAYIAPNGPREVNIPSEVRNQLLSLVHGLGGMPPPPNSLDSAVQHVYALMEESVLVPFLNSCFPQSAHPDYQNSSDENLNSASVSQPHPQHHHSQSASAHPLSRSYDERGLYRRSKRRSSPNQQHQPMSASYTASSSSMSSNRASAPSTFSQLARGLSVRGLATSSQRASASPYSASMDSKSPSPADSDMTDDLLSTVSTTTSTSMSANGGPVAGLHTPPTTPPMSDCQPYEGSPLSATISSPMAMESPREASAWKRVGTKLGLRKSQTRSRSGGSPGGVVMEEE
ncbi:regulator of G protein signaling superfamily [Rhizodiscina lignyota]|uniref:Regulator of G protein signaling superfamily n=1 Tax=Rhizodiscina lignyota TaxID=1504668 RepID=A0A9P4IIN8_9PEZI|nr:regulator of G protein signaling superfamily [Rhizodiscina lignyota]